MTLISRDDVLNLARLSSLQLTSDDVDALQKDMASILEYVEQLSELDTEGVTPTYQVHDSANVWRDDVVQTGVDTDTLLSLSPDEYDNQIKVPKVL